MLTIEPSAPPDQLFAGYKPIAGTYDELVESGGKTRDHARVVANILANMTPDAFARSQALAELALAQKGVTFSVYSDQRGTEKVMPVCLVPRVIASAEWARLERGLVQRLTALQLFLDDLYGEQRVLADRVVPAELVLASRQYVPRLRGLKPPGGVRIHIAGVDLIRSPDGVLRVLEDNLRTPSGVSYVIENRLVTKRMFPTALERLGVRRVDDYPIQLVEMLRSVSPVDPDESTVVVLTPGPFNSAYFEHSFLARSMGIELVEASDLFVNGDEVFVRTTAGPRRVHVIYRRTDDAFIDQEFFRPDSMLGVPGLMRAWAAGKVALANAPGNGVADDKAIYPFVPDLVRYYLGEEPLIEQVPTQVCARRADCQYVLEHLDQLVVKAVDEAGGYGMLMGPQASAAELEEFRGADRRRPAQVHRPAPHRAVDLPDLDSRRPAPGAAPHRPAPVRRHRQGWQLGAARGPDARGAAGRVVRRQLESGRGFEGHLGTGGRRVVISRVADHCFWVGRYIERAESTARLLQVTRALAFDAELPPLHCWRPLMIVSGQFPEFSAHFGADAAGNGDIVQRYMTWAPENPVSIRTSVRGGA